jgi:hypothetical protein
MKKFFLLILSLVLILSLISCSESETKTPENNEVEENTVDVEERAKSKVLVLPELNEVMSLISQDNKAATDKAELYFAKMLVAYEEMSDTQCFEYFNKYSNTIFTCYLELIDATSALTKKSDDLNLDVKLTASSAAISAANSTLSSWNVNYISAKMKKEVDAEKTKADLADAINLYSLAMYGKELVK